MKWPVEGVIGQFAIHGAYLESRPYGSGHINDTFVAAFSHAGTRVRYIFQRVNERIFQQAENLMENIQRVTEAAAAKLASEGVIDSTRRALRLIPAKNGRPFARDAEGRLWRCYLFIEGARTYDIIQNPRQAFQAARAFGEFQKLAAGLEGPRLHETIPNFHNTRARFNRLQEVVGSDPKGRLAEVGAEWDFIRSREGLVDLLLDLQASGAIPERVTHNDTKLNNVMIDDASGEGICVIDLDTVMPGLALYDFGDMVRTATSPALEDEPNTSKVCMQMPMFEELVRGYLSTAKEFLVEGEIDHLPFSGKLITLEIGIRFLTDYLEGDIYFKTKHASHNLDRCRTQLALVRSIEEQEAAMAALVRELAR
ncbi:MAG: aminoglycoside phosphotransferase family protein [Verrucomicrobiaceae bacterium]|nr:MAG: aminoglycoside phosphotransferase family protein [Verrucomicrobiaceae bacterium]